MGNPEKSVFKLGITGGIGSGKTSVCRVFNVLGIPFFSADPAAKEIMDTNSRVRVELNSIAGKDLYAGGKLNRTELAGIIFTNPEILARVNNLVHPLVFENFKRWREEQDAPYVIMEAAILFESGAYKLVDRVLTVVAPVDERVQRVIARNNLKKEDVLDRIRNQMDDEQKIKLSDYVIHNSENEMIIPEILRIHQEILDYIKFNS